MPKDSTPAGKENKEGRHPQRRQHKDTADLPGFLPGHEVFHPAGNFTLTLLAQDGRATVQGGNDGVSDEADGTENKKKSDG